MSTAICELCFKARHSLQHQSAVIVLSFSESCLLKNFAERGATEKSAVIVLSFSESCLLKNFAERGATEKSAVIVLSFSESCLLNEVRRKKASVAETRGGGEAAMPAAGVLMAGERTAQKYPYLNIGRVTR